jgi:alpha(1,3/1,4) fucosyltransferase
MMQEIKIFKIGRMSETLFCDERDINFLQEYGIRLVDNIFDCDIVMTARLHRLASLRLLLPHKKFLVWTHEPRYDQTFVSIHKGSLWMPDAHVMNTYTGEIFVNNYTLPFPSDYCRHEYWTKPLPEMDEVSFPDFTHRKIVALMGYKGDQRKASLKHYGEELDLSYLRCQIALAGYRLGKMDIYGPNWPENMALEDSRHGGSFQERKEKILMDYHFNLCFENTNFPYYCTEKIWDSIRFGCLPIYYGAGNKIYEDFPKSSFLDYAEIGSIDKLFSYIDQITPDEFRERMNLCIRTYNAICDKLKDRNRYQEFLLRIVCKVQEIADV